MSLSVIRAIAISMAAFAPLATASVANFGPTTQNITMTGLGGNALGEGQVRITWGNCVFDGSNTTCTVSAPFTGIGAGGTISFVLTYSGNGESPITAGSQSPGSNLLGPFSLTTGSFVTTIKVTGGATLTFDGEGPVSYYDQPGDAPAQCTGVSSCGVGQVGLTVGATISGQVSGSFDPTPVIKALISAGSFGGFKSIAPATWIEIYGLNLVSNAATREWSGGDFTNGIAPTALAGTTVTIAGQQAFIDYASPGQVNVQVPSNVPTGLQPVVVTTAGGSSLPDVVQVNSVEPGMLAPPVFQVNGTQYIVALFPDGITYVLPPGVTNAVPTRRAKPGDTVLFYGVGFGPVTPDIPAGQIAETSSSLNSSFKIFFAGTPAQANYFGLTPTFVGLYQFNVVVPNVAASDTVPVTFTVGTANSSQTMVTAVGN